MQSGFGLGFGAGSDMNWNDKSIKIKKGHDNSLGNNAASSMKKCKIL
jgi:hypothetical protein